MNLGQKMNSAKSTSRSRKRDQILMKPVLANAGTSQEHIRIVIEIGPGELLDRLTILEIKKERIRDPEKLSVVNDAFDRIDRIYCEIVNETAKLRRLKSQLRMVNEKLWDAENLVRALDSGGEFGRNFVNAARSIYKLNDERLMLKHAVDISILSVAAEVKEYSL